MTEMPLPREIRQSIRDKIAAMPTGTDPATGRTTVDEQLTAEHVARMAEADWTDVAGTVEPSAHAGMRPNPAQGAGGSTGVTPASAPGRGGSVLERIRDQFAGNQSLNEGIQP